MSIGKITALSITGAQTLDVQWDDGRRGQRPELAPLRAEEAREEFEQHQSRRLDRHDQAFEDDDAHRARRRQALGRSNCLFCFDALLHRRRRR